ncbi:unnamed protein product [Lactuca saligna]|uniref:Uncharacterized protein n=1 Tax=Lactuca saligna TaxID=75948 RepID=A0AA35V8Q6_LACSI|nr:unnamed protein product [Lactuca saligna]
MRFLSPLKVFVVAKSDIAKTQPHAILESHTKLHCHHGGFGDHQIDAKGKQPMKITFDINTHTPIGEVYECFIREVGSYMWRDIAFDKDTWKEVSEAKRVGMFQYLSICARYRGRKHTAKTRFIDFEWDVEGARIQAPIVVEVALQTHHIADSGGDADYIYRIIIFEKELGA